MEKSMSGRQQWGKGKFDGVAGQEPQQDFYTCHLESRNRFVAGCVKQMEFQCL